MTVSTMGDKIETAPTKRPVRTEQGSEGGGREEGLPSGAESPEASILPVVTQMEDMPIAPTKQDHQSGPQVHLG